MAIGKMSGESMKATGEDLVWNTELEVSLFYAMRGHKPVGVNKNFQMMCIHEKFNQATGRQVTSKQIWDHLETLYDMQALHESEILPFPNKEVDFSLPTTDFQDMMQQRSKKSGESFKALSTSSHDSSKSDTPKSLLKLGTPSGVLAGTPSEKDNSPKRKRTRQAGSTPTETPSTKRRR